ncbi:hypothetical protein G7009_18125 [Pseudomonas capeferrum]|jgi:hypothetical protein|uniref:hypothetical protein n=1 Tax=Pseudomonas TaxID=286 RepID=UPI0015E2FA21|nr:MULTISPECIES: hypothetical protein [Pseudomonas]MBA1203642.1 hypothetical protein [Pseudomonas capeferrum]
MLTFEKATAAYSELLALHPDKALRIDSYNIAFLLDGSLVGFCDADRKFEEGMIYDFDRSAWSDEEGGWCGAAEQTQAAINVPVYIDIPVFHC